MLAGDDPMAKSSTLPTQVEPAFYDAQIPILYPGTMQEVIDLGLHGIALSRYSGLWVAFKVVTTVADGFGVAEVAPDRIVPVDPRLEIDGQPWRHVQRPGLVTPLSLEQEKDIAYGRLEAAVAYAAANGLNEITGATGAARLGIVAAGRTFQELRQALSDLGLDDDALRRLGIRLLRLGMVWPLEPEIVRRFAAGLDEILVLDEKRAFIELFVRDILYRRAGAPRVVGKTDERGRRLVPADGELDADRIAAIVADRLRSGVLGGDIGALPVAVEARLALIEEAARAGAAAVARTPYWCSGCPPQPFDDGARRLVRRRRGGLPRHGAVDRRPGPDRPPDGRRGRHLDRPGAVHRPVPHLPERGRRDVLPLGQPGGEGRGGRGRRHHLQDPLQRRGRHDRRPGRGRVDRRGRAEPVDGRRGREPHHRVQRRPAPPHRRHPAGGGSRGPGTGTGSTRPRSCCGTRPA